MNKKVSSKSKATKKDSSKKETINDSSPNTNKSKNDPIKTEKRWKKITIWAVLMILIIIMLVLGHFLYKRCAGKKSEHTVSIVQPPSSYSLTVNGHKDSFTIKEGDNLDISIEATSSDYTTISPYVNEDLAYYVQIAKTGLTQETPYKNELSLVSTGKYKASFPMVWTYDITVSIVSTADYDDSIYSVNSDNQIDYLFDKSTIYDTSKSYITRINAINLAWDNIPKSEFGKVVESGQEDKVKNIHIGKNITEIYDNFLADCTSFNKKVIFEENCALQKIDAYFMYECEKFDQEFTFPNKLISVGNFFMCYCKAFNNGNAPSFTLDKLQLNGSYFFGGNATFNKPIIITSNITTIPSAFLLGCRKFNQDITIPITVEKVKDGFMALCDAMCSTITIECNKTAFNSFSGSADVCSTDNSSADCYVKGMKIAGFSRTEWMKCFQNLDNKDGYYRKLI